MFFVLYLGLSATTTLLGQNEYSEYFLIDVSEVPNGTLINSGGVEVTNDNIIIIPGNSMFNYILTGSTLSRRVIIQSGYNGTIILRNLSINSSAIPSPYAYGKSGYSCITVEGEYNRSNLQPITNVHFILDGKNNLIYSNIDYCALQVDQGAQIYISALNPDNNDSGKLVATTINGGAGIGAPNFDTPSKTNPLSNIGQGIAETIKCTTEPKINGAKTETTAGGNIIIFSGKIDAQGEHGAGIGGGFRTYYDGIIIIAGGNVTAVGKYHAAGIGSGCPNGTGVLPCSTPNSTIIALPPCTISAKGSQSGWELAGTATKIYINDPVNPLNEIFTEDKEPNATIYLDLTNVPEVVDKFKKLKIDYDLGTIKLGKTDENGIFKLHALIDQEVIFFTDHNSTNPNNKGYSYLPVSSNITKAEKIELPIVDIDISFVPKLSKPLQEGYNNEEALENAYRYQIIYNSHLPMSDVKFDVVNKTDFSNVKIYGSDGISEITDFTSFSLLPGNIIYAAIPIEKGKKTSDKYYSDMLRITGIWDGKPIDIRRSVEQEVIEQSPDTLTCTPSTLLFREDFGGNQVLAPVVAREGFGTDSETVEGLRYNPWPSSMYPTRLSYQAEQFLNQQNLLFSFFLQTGDYSFVKRGKSRNGVWYEPTDHTHPESMLSGYLMEVNGSLKPATYYSTTLTDVCPGPLQFSVWGMSLLKAIKVGENAELRLQIKNDKEKILKEKAITLTNGKGAWEQFELLYDVKPGETTLTFEIINNKLSEKNSYFSNDFALDDIEVRMCSPKVDLQGAAWVCERNELKIAANVNPNDFTEPSYQWVKSESGNINEEWEEIPDATEPTLSIENAGLGNAAYYRLEITDGEGSCPAKSDPLRVSVRNCDECAECVSSFAPVPGEKYVLSAWVKETGHTAVDVDNPPTTLTGNELTITSYENSLIRISFENSDQEIGAMAEGAIIDGWQRIHTEFTVPAESVKLFLDLGNTGVGESYFDDIRIYPANGSMKSYVYDPVTRRLTAELDEENYATFYEYDEEGALIRVKKETERGIMTIREARQGQQKKE
jgi:hypothetical protein